VVKRTVLGEAMTLNSRLASITIEIVKRSQPTRKAYLDFIAQSRRSGPARGSLSCGNLAHGFAASEANDKLQIKQIAAPNIGIITAYNDMLSAHQPFETYPQFIKSAAREFGATAQVAGGVPAMCDGVTQGRPGMELSLFSRDVIAQATAIALSHDMFDAAVCLGVCDKIVPGLLIGALAFGHLPFVFIPAGPMMSGLSNKAKAEVRERYADGRATRDELLEAEAASYHSAGTCTFYGTANSNQALLEAMGLQLPGTSFINPGTPLREALTRHATERAISMTALGEDYRPIGEIVDERAIVNALVMLTATGGSTNHTIHWVAVARAAGIIINWDDFDAIGEIVPLMTHIYPNGEADVNHFHAAGGLAFVIRELIQAGLMHGDIATIAAGTRGLVSYTDEPVLTAEGRLHYQDGITTSADSNVLRGVANPFERHGGIKLLKGNLGRALIKTSAVKPEYRRITAPAVVVSDPKELNLMHKAGTLPHDFVAVVRFQGPRANGMPEMHSLTPLLGLLQGSGHRVALVTDGRLSGASGKVPAAIHVTPETLCGGALARVMDGDMVTIDGETGEFHLHVDAAIFAARVPVTLNPNTAHDLGRTLFGFNRANVGSAEEGALSISCAV
jgi:phosphogluconate dehydratase